MFPSSSRTNFKKSSLHFQGRRVNQARHKQEGGVNRVSKDRGISSSETSVNFYRATRRQISEYCTLHSHWCKNLNANSVTNLRAPQKQGIPSLNNYQFLKKVSVLGVGGVTSNADGQI